MSSFRPIGQKLPFFNGNFSQNEHPLEIPDQRFLLYFVIFFLQMFDWSEIAVHLDSKEEENVKCCSLSSNGSIFQWKGFIFSTRLT